MVMRAGWYVLVFHDVSWEESLHVSGIAGTYPPDAFEACVRELSNHATLVGVDEGMRRWQSGTLDRPYVSFWFDDAFAGVRRYASPILERFGITGAISVNSGFTDRREMFWRAKLSFLSHCDGMRFLRSRMRARGVEPGQSVRKSSLDSFSPALLDDIDALYERFTSPEVRADAFRLFDDWDGLRALRDSGWTIANHSASHYPLLESSAVQFMAEQFTECERVMEREMGVASTFWVAPFDRPDKRDPRFQETFDACAGGRTLVLVGHRINLGWQAGQPLSRIGPPADLTRLMSILNEIPVA
jgi:peptidoglycan/xylan/chitin deacetylase (PgdA/CDA1 family)